MTVSADVSVARREHGAHHGRHVPENSRMRRVVVRLEQAEHDDGAKYARMTATRAIARLERTAATCAGPDYLITKDQRSDRERRSAAATPRHSILERESEFLEVALVVDHRAVQVLRAESSTNSRTPAFQSRRRPPRLRFDVKL